MTFFRGRTLEFMNGRWHLVPDHGYITAFGSGYEYNASVDASGVMTARVQRQRGDDGIEHPTLFAWLHRFAVKWLRRGLQRRRIKRQTRNYDETMRAEGFVEVNGMWFMPDHAKLAAWAHAYNDDELHCFYGNS